MAKALITTPQGVKVQIDGTPAEIAKVLADLQVQKTAPDTARQRFNPKGRATISDHIASLIDGNFFSKPKTLGEVKNALAEMGHHYPVTTLSPTMLRQVRQHKLRRLKETNHWVYVNS